ncbi:UDP-N-acetylmuramoyl-L-alanine--D-glutamate ligase [Bdellovibrionota bacterium]
MELKQKNCLVVGLGISGLATAKFLHKHGAKVVVTDTRSEKELKKEINELKPLGVSFDLGKHNPDSFRNRDLIVVSPGVPYNIPTLNEARSAGVEIIGEVELAFQHLSVPILAITGTNGKSTTASLLHEMIIKEGKHSFLGGNIGRPLIELALSGESPDFAVVEVSSFQLETTKTFHPHIAICLNVTPDHLDRHSSFEEYVNFKRAIYAQMTKDDLLILYADDEIARTFGDSTSTPKLLFSRRSKVDDGCEIKEKSILFHGKAGTGELSLKQMKLFGEHNKENIAAAALAARSVGISNDSIQSAINEFTGLNHRMQFVRELNGVKFYNDSKGTNVGSTLKSLESFNEAVVLISGGKDKETDLSPLSPTIEKTRAIILFGEAKSRMEKTWGKLTQTFVVDTLDEAVSLSKEKAKEGDVVLFSPACSSFDQFKDYVERGNAFIKAVNELS